VTFPNSQDAASTQLSSVLDLVQAQVLRDDLIRLLQDGAMVLDAGAVERMSTPCAQVLLAAGRAAEAAGTNLQIVNASEGFRSALADLGLQTEFKHWVI
jgi:anti-anti-sigma regulatory factor